MKCRRVVASLLGLLLAVDVLATACECGPPPPMCQRFQEVKVMFVGTPVETNDDDVGIRGGLWYRFKVEEAFKGIEPGTSEIIVDPASGTSCQTEFQLGKRYLITSYGDTLADQHSRAISIIGGSVQGGKPRPSGAVVTVGGCSGSMLIEDASEDIAFIRQYQRAPQPANIIGAVRAGDAFFGWDDEHPPISDVHIEVKGSGKAISATTDEEGRFVVPNLDPGKYKVTAAKPNYRSGEAAYEVEVPQNGCGVAQIELMTNARVSGRVLRHDGSPAAQIPIELVFANKKYRDTYFRLHSAETDTRGRFRIAGLPAGDFLIGAYIESGPTMSARIPPTYWPGTTVEPAAGVVHLLPGQEQRNVLIRLAAPVRTRTVKVHVRWPDGRPAKAAFVFASPHGDGEINNASDGEFTLLEEIEYELTTRFWTSYREWNGNKVGGKFIDGEGVLPAGTGPAEITLVLDKPCCGASKAPAVPKQSEE